MVVMDEWENQIKALIKAEITKLVSLGRYTLRPSLQGLNVYCDTCARVIAMDTSPKLEETLDEVRKHEETHHNGLKLVEGGK